VGVLYFCRHWTDLHLCVGILCCIGLPTWFFIPESPRWLAGNKKKEEAEEVFLSRRRRSSLVKLSLMCHCRHRQD
jgi:hypothetical protein